MERITSVLVLLAGASSAWAHNVYPADGGTMDIFYNGPAGQVSVTHFTGEDCVVTATAVEIVVTTPLLKITPSTMPALDVFFYITAARHPQGLSETTAVQLEWAATGNNTSGQPESDCDGSGEARFNVTVSTNLPMPTISNTAAPVNTPTDPVNLQNGEFYFDEKPDIYLGGPMPLAFNRYFASLLQSGGTTPSPLGTNRSHNFLFYMIPPAGGTATIVDNRGRTITFQQSAGGFIQVSPAFAGYQLVSSGSGYTMSDSIEGRFYNFNSSGALVSVQDRNGNTHSLTYTGGNLAGISDGLGRSLTLVYDSNNHLVSVSDGNRTVGYAYSLNNLTSVTDVRGNTTQYGYDVFSTQFGLITQKTTPLGNVTTQTWSAGGQVTAQTNAVGNTTQFAYGSNTAQTDALGHTEVYAFDSSGLLTSETDENGKTSTYTYDGAGRRTSWTDALGNKTGITYDTVTGEMLTYTQPDGSVATFTFGSQTQSGTSFPVLTKVTFTDKTTQSMVHDGNGNITSLTDRAGYTMNVTWNSRGQILTLTNPAGGVSTFTYGNNGTVSSVQDSAGNTTSFGYDSAFRANLITHADGTTRRYTFDAAGNMLSDTDERGKTAQFTYDADGNLTSITDPLGNVTAFGYDAMERLISVTDPKGAKASRTFDSAGRVSAQTDRNGNTDQFTYDPASNLTGLTDPVGSAWSTTVDADGFPLTQTDPLNHAWSYAADSLERFVTGTSPLKAAVNVTYDSGGRISTFTDPSGVQTAFTPDPRDLIAGVSKGNGLVSSAYKLNALGLATQVTDGNGWAWQNNYDAGGRLLSETDPLGAVSAFAYNNRNRVSQITYPANLGNLQLTYDATGHIIEQHYSDGTDLTFTFDDASRLTAATGLTFGYDAVGEVASSNGITITRDAGGRIASMTFAPGKTVNYAYDARDQVTKVTDWVGGVTSITYDSSSKPVSIARPNGITAALTYNADNRLTGIQESGNTQVSSITLQPDGHGTIISETKNLPLAAPPAAGVDPFSYNADSQISGYTYDALGRLTADAGRTYIWDLASRLASYTDGTGPTTFTYDAFGRQASQTRGGVTRSYVWNYALGQQSISIVRQGGSDLRYYVHTPDGALLYSIEASGNARHFYHFDETGNTVYLTDDNGNVTDSYSYTPNGVPTGQSGNTDNPFTFAGQFGVMQEASSGLYYMRARFYDAPSAHFLSRDPSRGSSDPNETNLYSYARANPLLYSDPSGLFARINGDLGDPTGHTDFTVEVWRNGQYLGLLTASFGEGAYRNRQKNPPPKGGGGSSGSSSGGVLVGGQGTFFVSFQPGTSIYKGPGPATFVVGTPEQDERAAQYILSSLDLTAAGLPEYQVGTPAEDYIYARLKENLDANGHIHTYNFSGIVKGSGDWTKYGIIWPNRTCNTFTGTMLNIYYGTNANTGITAASVGLNLTVHQALPDWLVSPYSTLTWACSGL